MSMNNAVHSVVRSAELQLLHSTLN